MSCGIAFNIWIKISHAGFVLAMSSKALSQYIKESREPMNIEMNLLVGNMCTVCLDLCAIIVYYEVAETDRQLSLMSAEKERLDEEKATVNRISALSKFLQPQDLESAYLLPSGDILLSAG